MCVCVCVWRGPVSTAATRLFLHCVYRLIVCCRWMLSVTAGSANQSFFLSRHSDRLTVLAACNWHRDNYPFKLFIGIQPKAISKALNPHRLELTSPACSAMCAWMHWTARRDVTCYLDWKHVVSSLSLNSYLFFNCSTVFLQDGKMCQIWWEYLKSSWDKLHTWISG